MFFFSRKLLQLLDCKSARTPKVINYDVKHKNTDGVHKNYDVKRINTDVVYNFFHPLRQKKTKKQMKSGGAMKKSWKKVCT